MDGIINVYKPVGITSFDAVRNIRKLANTKKVGHTGTLDPLACGVLPICIGKATKIVDYIMVGRKEYIAEMKLGVVTDTYDREGKEISKHSIEADDIRIEKVIKSFIGDIMQVPPMYSAIKINGKKLYELARNGVDIERPARPVTIFDIEIIDIGLPFVKMKVKCSKGTYIRSLCYDIGKMLGCGAVLWNLERTQTGAFSCSTSVKLEDISKDNMDSFIIPIDSALSDYERLDLPDTYKKLLVNGVSVCDKSIIDSVNRDIEYRVYCNNSFLGMGKLNSNGFKITKLLI